MYVHSEKFYFKKVSNPEKRGLPFSGEAASKEAAIQILERNISSKIDFLGVLLSHRDLFDPLGGHLGLLL